MRATPRHVRRVRSLPLNKRPAKIRDDGTGPPPPAAPADPGSATHVSELRATVNGSLTNLGLLGSFLCALASCIYVDPPPDPHCHGGAALRWIYLCEWLGMGFFFLVIVTTVILGSDLDGIPDGFLVPHLRDNVVLYSAPHLLIHCGIVLLAIGYGIDLDERLGCASFPFGVVAAPFFPVLTFGLMEYLRRRRRRSWRRYAVGMSERRVAVGWGRFATWSDLFLLEPGGVDAVREEEELLDDVGKLSGI